MGPRVLTADQLGDVSGLEVACDSGPMRVAVISLFPEMFDAVTENGITGRAVKKNLVALRCFNPRDFATDKHRTVDDRPYGGGPGMVMRVAPLQAALSAAKEWLDADDEGSDALSACRAKVIYMSPQGQALEQRKVSSLTTERKLVLIAGRYEGVDERFVDAEVDEEISIGDYVLSGGELPAMVLLDACIRRLPGALGDALSAEQDSFEGGLLDCPHYTRPEVLAGVSVPGVLMSGDHKKIEVWRLKQSLGRTAERRPDMLKSVALTDAQKVLLEEYIAERE